MLNFAPKQFASIADTFQSHIDQSMVDARAKEPKVFNPIMGPEGFEVERKTVTAGIIGKECTRAIAYEYHRYSKDPGREPAGSMLRIFERGHGAEERMAKIMETAGFTVLTKNAYGKQFRFDQLPYEDGKGRIKGMADGVITVSAMPQVLAPCLWENKEVNTKNWKKLSSKGVKETKPEYYIQMLMLMGYLGLTSHPALFTAKCADTQDIYAELVPFDVTDVQKASDKAVRVAHSQSPDDFPRITNDPTNFKCKLCDFHDRCWAAPTQQGPAPTPTWLSNAVEPR